MADKIEKGDFVAIEYKGTPYYGRVQSANNYFEFDTPDVPNWYIEMKGPDGPHYWKQKYDGGRVHVIAPAREDCLVDQVLDDIYDEYWEEIVAETKRRVLEDKIVTEEVFEAWRNDGSDLYDPESKIFAVYRQVQHEFYEHHLSKMLVIVRTRLYTVDV